MEYHAIQRYGTVAQCFHWATALLVLCAFIYGPGGSEQQVYASTRDFDRQLHETIGSCVFVLVALRVLWRLVDTRPAPPKVPMWMALAAKAVQGALYLLLFSLPLTAISGAWLEGHPLTLIAGVKISSPFEISHDAGATIATIHTWLGDAIVWLAGLHALAALYHHVILKDNVLVAILPRWFPLRESK